ncbi:MAG: peptidoglycan-binding protein [Hyphomicrobiales bacterium]
MPSVLPLLIAGTVAALGGALASSKSKKGKGQVELDANLPDATAAQVLGALANEKSAAKLIGFADQMDAQGYHLTAAALRARAAELPSASVETAPAAAPSMAAVVSPAPTVQVTPSNIGSLDPNMDAQTRGAVIHMLTSETDPARLQGFAGSIQHLYPISAGLLWGKSAAMVAQQRATAAIAAAAPAPSPYVQASLAPGVITPAVSLVPTAAPVVQAPPAGLSYRLATNADVARDHVQPRYQALLSQPVGTQVQEMHNGRAWQFRVVSKTTDPGLTTYAKDVKGWVGGAPAQLGPAPAPVAYRAPAAAAVPAASPTVPARATAAPAMFAGPAAGVFAVNTNQDVQRALNQLGFKGANGQALTVDGSIGPNSQAAVRKFQGNAGLKVDGIPGPLTKSALAQALRTKAIGTAA